MNISPQKKVAVKIINQKYAINNRHTIQMIILFNISMYFNLKRNFACVQ